MKFLKTIKIFYDAISLTKLFMKVCVKNIQARKFMSEAEINVLMAKVNKNYTPIAKEYVSELPAPSLPLKMSFFTHSLMASAIFHLKGDYKSSNEIAQYYLDNLAPNTEKSFTESVHKAVSANNLRLVLLEKEETGMTDSVREKLEIMKAELFINKSDTGGHLGEKAMCYFLMDNKDEALNQLNLRVQKDKGNVEKCLDEIYENPGISHTKIGQEYFSFIENFVHNFTPTTPAQPPSLKM